MTKTADDLLLDNDGVPLLTDTVEPGTEYVEAAYDETEYGDAGPLDLQPGEMSADDTIRAVLGSAAVRRRLDEISALLVEQYRGQVEQLLRPAIEQAVTEVMDDSRNAAFNAIREQLNARLPALLAEALRDAPQENT